ncbi:MAG: adenylyl-sulfate reductase subunit beta [SAR324 cluster bacterium]|jgi:adenylylsulfate reductase subunit B|nr:adenylyl-sulfate reductase subunit beta [SAR324 cluster bacterium]MDP6744863.1 adenylyl-sulfate reductase subunit beta [SAR324 cluster bacterium]
MPSFVITEKCDGCQGQEKTACMYICPHDLMALKEVVDKDTNEVKMKGVNQEPVQCWECYNCVKICPQQAISVRCYADFAPLGGEVIPMLGSDSIMWTVKFRNGNLKRFKFPVRTVEAGNVDIRSGVGEASADISRIKDPGFYTHHASGSSLPTPS